MLKKYTWEQPQTKLSCQAYNLHCIHELITKRTEKIYKHNAICLWLYSSIVQLFILMCGNIDLFCMVSISLEPRTVSCSWWNQYLPRQYYNDTGNQQWFCVTLIKAVPNPFKQLVGLILTIKFSNKGPNIIIDYKYVWKRTAIYERKQ